MNKFLNVPVYIWFAQIAYVTVGLTVLAILVSTLKQSETFNTRSFAAAYVVVMIIVNIIWRLIVAKLYR